MTNIQPFKAITPISGVDDYEIKNQLVFCPNKKSNFRLEQYTEKLIYINELINQNLLQKNTSDNFYCCKISNKNIAVIGLIALVNTDLVNKIIFKHERCIHLKQDRYLNNFKNDKIQISPIMLVHEDNLDINRNLNNVANQHSPFFTIEDHEYKYEIWNISDISLYKNLYRSIGSFLVADGHHRLSSINTLRKNKFITAFLTSVDHIKLANIYRKYSEVSHLSKKKLFFFLNKNFNLTKVAHVKKEYLFNNKFLFKIDDDFFEISYDNNDSIKRDILEFLDKSINYSNNRINFCNHPFTRHDNLFLYAKSDVSLIIPAHNIQIKQIPLYPPHSTFFYPKLPEGLISFNT